MALPASHPFTGTGALDTGLWDTHGGIIPSRSGGKCQFNAGATTGARWIGDSFAGLPDHFSRHICTTLSSIGPTVRQPSDATFYIMDCQTTGANNKLYYFHSSATYVLVATPGSAFVNGDSAKLGAVGTTLTCYKNDVSIGTGTDGNLAAGMPGIWGFSATSQLDDWSGDAIATATAVPVFMSQYRQRWR